MGITFTERIKQFFGIQSALSEEFFEELTDLLVEGDVGPAGAYRVADKLREVCRKEKITRGEDARRALARLLEGMLMAPGSGAAGLFDAHTEGRLDVILLLGVNGVGKTTTAAKLAHEARERGRKPVLAAADTFRAAAIEQLKIHGERLGARVVAHKRGGDPAAVVYDALDAALSGAGDIIIADTAGRMHTKSALVEELKKIDRVVEAKAGRGAGYSKWLVLDATTGRNALSQARTFHEAVSPDGAVLTKCDSGAKGGVVFSLAEELGMPVVFLCNGEGYRHLAPFNPHEYAHSFAGLD
ncbi:MAG: signal recognition particle-docking protein FtsY [Spirochaetaceae bacterium]|jgi:fused signal recognition particle receptor|nr:signal recognition particle-docking protein FtsY [Spirochaetaceae bacterium]